MGGTDAKSAVGTAEGIVIELCQGRPVVAGTQFEVVAVEARGGLADDAGRFYSRGLVEGGEPSGGDVVAEVFGHGGHSVGDDGRDIDLLALFDHRFVAAGDNHTFIIYIAVGLGEAIGRDGPKADDTE